MPFWDENTGAVQLTADARLYAHMPGEEVHALCAAMVTEAGFYAPPAGEAMVPFPAFSVPGGRLACVCLLHHERLHAVTFHVVGVGQRKRGTAEQQRALLFGCLWASDPSRDSKRSVLLRCPFGAALVTTDPHTGDATLRLTYR